MTPHPRKVRKPMVCKCKHGRIWHLKSGVCGYDGSVIGEQDYCDARCKKFPSQKPSGESMEKAREVVHQCPTKGSGIMPCCGKTPSEAVNDRMTNKKKLVNCSAPSSK